MGLLRDIFHQQVKAAGQPWDLTILDPEDEDDEDDAVGYAKDAAGHEHKGKGEGGGQFTSGGGGGGGGDRSAPITDTGWKAHIKDHYGGWSAAAPPADKKAVVDYVAHPWINSYLRSGTLPDAKEIKAYSWTTGNKELKTQRDARQMTDRLDAALASLPPTSHAMTVHRFIPVTDRDNDPGRAMYDALASGELKAGSVLTDKGYQSTSYGSPVARGGSGAALFMKINVPKGSKALPPEAVGVSSQSEDQREFVLPRNARYTITDVTQEGGAKIVHVDYTPGEDEAPKSKTFGQRLKGLFGLGESKDAAGHEHKEEGPTT